MILSLLLLMMMMMMMMMEVERSYFCVDLVRKSRKQRNTSLFPHFVVSISYASEENVTQHDWTATETGFKIM